MFEGLEFHFEVIERQTRTQWAAGLASCTFLSPLSSLLQPPQHSWAEAAQSRSEAAFSTSRAHQSPIVSKFTVPLP